jgi:membrane-associated phospholipid phosphatase
MIRTYRGFPVFFLVPYFLVFSVTGWVILQAGKTDSFLWVNSHRQPLADVLFPYFTHVGDGLFNLGITLLFLAISYRWALHFLGGFALSSLLSVLCKEWWFKGWPRPRLYFEQAGIPIQFIEGVTVHSYNSFPSGHTLTAFSVFALLAAWRPQPLWSIAMLILALLAAYSRVYLAQHFPVDVWVGSFAGLGCSFLSYQLIEATFSKHQPHWADRSLLSGMK